MILRAALLQLMPEIELDRYFKVSLLIVHADIKVYLPILIQGSV